jgi:hypothetical protein
LHELDNRQDRELADLLANRTRAFRRLHQISSISRMRAPWSPLPKMLSESARHPSIWPWLARRIFGIN